MFIIKFLVYHHLFISTFCCYCYIISFTTNGFQTTTIITRNNNNGYFYKTNSNNYYVTRQQQYPSRRIPTTTQSLSWKHYLSNDKIICQIKVSAENDINDDDDNNNYNNNGNKERIKGILVLLSVPLAWGTYSPVVKYLYTDYNIPGFLFSLSYYAVAAITLWCLVFINNNDMNNNNKTRLLEEIDDNNNNSYVENSDNDNEPSNNIIQQWIGGIELGMYLFIGNVLQVLGLQLGVPADRAGFIVQLTTVIVPILQAILLRTIILPWQTWFACILAFIGVIIINIDGKDVVAPSIEILQQQQQNSFLLLLSGGDILILMAAFVYSLHVVRLDKYAKQTTALRLAASKATVEAILSFGLVLTLIVIAGSNSSSVDSVVNNNNNSFPFHQFLQQTGIEIQTFLSSSLSTTLQEAGSVVAFAVLWTGWVTCAYTIYAQSFGQRRVQPTDANLIYTVQPLFTSLFAYILLNETLGTYGWIGATFIATAVYIVAANNNNNSNNNSNTSIDDVNNVTVTTSINKMSSIADNDNNNPETAVTDKIRNDKKNSVGQK